MFCLQGMKLAEKPRGWLGCSDISNHAGSAATQDRFLLPTPRCWTSWAMAPKCSSCQLQLKAVLLVLNSDRTWKRLGASQVCTRGTVEKRRGHLCLVVGACLTNTQEGRERGGKARLCSSRELKARSNSHPQPCRRALSPHPLARGRLGPHSLAHSPHSAFWLSKAWHHEAQDGQDHEQLQAKEGLVPDFALWADEEIGLSAMQSAPCSR